MKTSDADLIRQRGEPPENVLIQVSNPKMAPKNGTWILLAAILGSSMVFIDGTVINVALPALQAAFHTSGTTLQWVIEAYALSLASLLLLGGSFGDLYGRKRIFVIGIILFAISSAVCGFAIVPSMIIVSRAVQGVGGALLVPGSLALISGSFPEETRGRAIGVWSGSTAVTASLGPLMGGWLIQHVSWRWIFFINVPIALLVVAVCLQKVPESRDPNSTRPDWLGATLAAVGLGLSTFALVESADRPLNFLAILLLGVLFLAGFVLWESKTISPMMPLELFRSKSFGLANGTTFLIYAALSGALYYLPQQLIQIEHYRATQAGAVLLPMTILIATLSRWMGGVVQRVGARLPLVLGSICSSIGYALLLRLTPGGTYLQTVLPGVLFLGFGLATLVAPLTTTVMNSVSQERSGTASGINNAVSNTSSVLAIAICGRMFSSSFAGHLRAGLSQSNLSQTVQEEIFSHHNELGGMIVAGGQSRKIVDNAFEASLHLVLALCCLLTILAAVIALFLDHRKSANDEAGVGTVETAAS